MKVIFDVQTDVKDITIAVIVVIAIFLLRVIAIHYGSQHYRQAFNRRPMNHGKGKGVQIPQQGIARVEGWYPRGGQQHPAELG